jgi:hypothetical protein
MKIENPTRYFFGAIGLGVGCGIAWTLWLIDSPRFITRQHAEIVLYGIVGVIFSLQALQYWFALRKDVNLIRRDRNGFPKDDG